MMRWPPSCGWHSTALKLVLAIQARRCDVRGPCAIVPSAAYSPGSFTVVPPSDAPSFAPLLMPRRSEQLKWQGADCRELRLDSWRE
uniref:Uncharacterized protein n=1 Tax=Arundo donax TaxID=35708 RepID=A0A0A9I209_ARUDO